MTWCSSTDVSAAVSPRTGWSVSGGTASKAGFAGASTVSSGAVLSESARLAVVTACTSVDSAGLALAAVATGTVAMPAKLPAPSVGTAAHPAPNGVVAAAGAVVGPADALAEVDDDDELLSEEPPELQAPSVTARPEDTAMATPRVRRVLVTWRLLVGPFGAFSRRGQPNGRSGRRHLDRVPARRPGREGIGRGLRLRLAVARRGADGDCVPPGGEVGGQHPRPPEVGVGRRRQLGVGPGAAVDPHLHPGDPARLRPRHAGHGPPPGREGRQRRGRVDPGGDL